MRNWTKEQSQAIFEKDKNILVSAGAGSGKTAVLTERVINKLKEKVKINELLILTFTNAAALEMKERIRKEIISNEELVDQLLLIDEAYITTFDSYSLSLVKKYHYLLNTSSNINIVESTIINKLKEDYLEEIFLNYYSEKNPLFEKFISTYTVKDDKSLQKMLLTIYDRITLIYDQKKYLENFTENYFNDQYIATKKEQYYQYLINELAEVKDIINDMLSEFEESYTDKILDELKFIYDDFSYNNLVTKITTKLPNLPRGSSDYQKELKDKLKEKLEKINNVLIYEDEQQLINSYYFNKDFSKLITDVFLSLTEKLDEYKYYHNAFEFIDITKLAIDLVSNYPEVSNNLKNSYHEIMIDEYQDTNDLQEMFIKNISNNNLYMVGDIKQSIYGFRNANPMIFQDKYRQYQNQENSIKIDLNKNFRSRLETITAINEIFDLVMTDQTGGAKYQEQHQMVFGNNSYEITKELSQNYSLDVLKYGSSDFENYSLAEKEIFIIVNDIKEKVQNHYQILDLKTNQLRNAKYSDFTILLDRSTDFNLYKKIFEYEAIPLNILADDKLTNNDELLIIKNILLLVHKIFNKEYDQKLKYAFAAVSRSYISKLTDQEIFDYLTNNNYFETELMQKLSSLSYQVADISISDLLLNIYDQFNLYEKVITVGSVEKRHVALSYLLMLATNLEKLEYTLEDFVMYLENIINNDIDIKYSINANLQNAATIMTIHKSKGLEFSVCYYAGLTKKFNISELNDDFLYHNKYGIIMPIFDEGIKPTIDKLMLKEEYTNDQISESIRLFYVALTRAKEKMIIVVPDKEAKLNRINSFFDIITKANSNISQYVKTISLADLNLNKDYNSLKHTNYQNSIKQTNNYSLETFNYQKELNKEASFSKKITSLITLDKQELINQGLIFHNYLENINFKNPDFTDIEEPYLNKIKKLLENEILKDISNKRIFQEYEFFFKENDTIYNGIIDLLIESNKEIMIIDYKLSNINDKKYIDQLNGYKNYITKKTNKKVTIYLYSILNEELKELNEKETLSK